MIIRSNFIILEVALIVFYECLISNPATMHNVHLSKMLNIEFQKGSAATLSEWCFISLAITNTKLINVLMVSLN